MLTISAPGYNAEDMIADPDITIQSFQCTSQIFELIKITKTIFNMSHKRLG